LSDEYLEHSVAIDMELTADQITFQMARELQSLEPYGAGNPPPVFMTKNLRCLSEPTVIKDRHLKMRLAGSNNRPTEAIWWNCIEPGEPTPQVQGSIEVAYTIETTVWKDEFKLQLNVQDLRKS